MVNLYEAGEGLSRNWKSGLLRKGIAWIPRNWQKVSDDTGIGNPKLSTAEKGARYVADAISVYADLLYDLNSDNLYDNE